ncbi:MAG: helix-turn-helix domain-containing protein [Rhodobacteraceae bacterium]|nr:helix-turn-helix domain-containing protein [Paracoccaceae bacterium]
MPHIRWLEARDRPVDSYLAAAGVPGDPLEQSERPIPLRSAFAFLRNVAEGEGVPDLGLQVMTSASFADLGNYAQVILGGRSIEQALQRASRAMPHFCTHEWLDLRRQPGGAQVIVTFSIGTDQAALHQAQLLTLTFLFALAAVTRNPGPLAEQIRIVPHPELGFSHLPPEFGAIATPADDRVMIVSVGNGVMATPLPRSMTPVTGPGDHDQAWRNLRDQADFRSCARMLVEGMVEDGTPDVDLLAKAAGISLRTLQRRLAAEGTSFKELVDQTRKRNALAAIAEPGTAIAEIASAVGYASPSALTRAVRRWKGKPPRALREK